MIKTLILAAALLVPSAVSAKCPDTVGEDQRRLIEIFERSHTTYSEGYAKNTGLVSRREVIQEQQTVLSEKVKLGYTYLDAGCIAEARAVFSSVWAWNSPDYTEQANQAREALNLLSAKRP